MPNIKKKHLLHIYEDVDFNQTLEQELEKTEYNLISETNFNKVFSILNKDIKLIIISHKALTRSMSDFFKHFKASDYNNIPLIAIVSTRENIYTKNIMKMGYNDYISMENAPKTIVTQIIDFLDKRDNGMSETKIIKVAIIDDDILHNQLVRRALENKGINDITIFKSGEEYLTYLKKCDVYLVDIVMKKISGIKVVQHIRELYPDALIVVVSSVAEDKLVTTALLKGADDFIKKPINFEIFLAKMMARIK